MSAPHSVIIDELDRDEIVALLSRNHVGRIAFSMHDRVDIQPIHYVYSDGWLYGRTSHGAKFATLMKNRWVAFEVDEVTTLFDWTSAVVHGAVSAPMRMHLPSAGCICHSLDLLSLSAGC